MEVSVTRPTHEPRMPSGIVKNIGNRSFIYLANDENETQLRLVHLIYENNNLTHEILSETRCFHFAFTVDSMKRIHLYDSETNEHVTVTLDNNNTNNNQPSPPFPNIAPENIQGALLCSDKYVLHILPNGKCEIYGMDDIVRVTLSPKNDITHRLQIAPYINNTSHEITLIHDDVMYQINTEKKNVIQYNLYVEEDVSTPSSMAIISKRTDNFIDVFGYEKRDQNKHTLIHRRVIAQDVNIQIPLKMHPIVLDMASREKIMRNLMDTSVLATV